MTNQIRRDLTRSETGWIDDTPGPPRRGIRDGGEQRAAVLVCDLDGTITYVNRAFEGLSVAAEDEPVGSSVRQYLADDATQRAQELFRQLQDGESVHSELTLEAGAGEQYTFLFEPVRFDPNGTRHLIGLHVDRTEQDRAAAKSALLSEVSRGIGAAESYRSGLETALEAICTYTEWTYGEVWTPADTGDYLEFSLGYTDDARAETFLRASEDVTFAFGAGLPGRVYDSESPEWIPDASQEPLELFHRAEQAAAADLRAAFAVPIVADDTVVSVITFFLRDRREHDTPLSSDVCDVVSSLGGLVERKQLEARRKRQNEQLDSFTSTVSHDLRNPLSVAQGYLELAQHGSSPEALGKVENALDRMDELVENLLALSQQGNTIGEQTQISLAETAGAAWECVETAEATVDITDGQLQGDPTRIQQLFENLIRNAIQHAGPTVTVRVGPLSPIGTATRSGSELATGFYVEDDGPGIPPDERESVFDAAYSTGGTGLGLQTVEEISTAHGWTVSCTEGRDGGARFEFRDTAGSATLDRRTSSGLE